MLHHHLDGRIKAFFESFTDEDFIDANLGIEAEGVIETPSHQYYSFTFAIKKFEPSENTN